MNERGEKSRFQAIFLKRNLVNTLKWSHNRWFIHNEVTIVIECRRSDKLPRAENNSI